MSSSPLRHHIIFLEFLQLSVIRAVNIQSYWRTEAKLIFFCKNSIILTDIW